MKLGIPNGSAGSGLSTLVGPNNSGKSTIIEAFNALNSRDTPSFSTGKRNVKAGDKVEIILENTDGNQKSIISQENSSSETNFLNREIEPTPEKIYVIPSRRYFNPYFNKNEVNRERYVLNNSLPQYRGAEIRQFSQRLFDIQNNKKEEFNDALGKVLTPCPNWTIDRSDHGQYFLKFKYDELSHSSDGVGDGIISLFFAISSLFDSREEDIIVIDEPELSLHPSLQKKLMSSFKHYAKSRQIIISTHSPYFIDVESIVNGGRIVRVNKDKLDSNIHILSEEIADKFDRFTRNYNNPHVFGLTSKEVFFLDDNIILTEGQEDVIFYNKLLNQLNLDMNAKFYGWGVGGAGNMDFFSQILKELGFKKVIGVLDNDKQHMLEELNQNFGDFRYLCIPADDIRTKEARPAMEERKGLLDEDYELREEYHVQTEDFFEVIINYFQE